MNSRARLRESGPISDSDRGGDVGASYYPGVGCDGVPAKILKGKPGWRGARGMFADIQLGNGRVLKSVHVGPIPNGAYVDIQINDS